MNTIAKNQHGGVYFILNFYITAHQWQKLEQVLYQILEAGTEEKTKEEYWLALHAFLSLHSYTIQDHIHMGPPPTIEQAFRHPLLIN